jgi:NAD(P)-dependent dehydrogenase (short-subunit alcohol dehydrogenase family)
MSLSDGERPRLILTGASGTFGSAFISAYRARFDIIAITNGRSLSGDSQHSETFDVLDQGAAAGASAREVKCDLLDRDRTADLMRDIVDIGGPVTFLINAAADTRFLGSTTEAVYFQQQAVDQFQANVLAPMLIASVLFHRCWKKIPVTRQKAAILNISSVSGRNVFRGVGQATYAASKAALDMVTLHMADEYRAFGVKVNGLAPPAFPADVSTDKIARAAFNILTSNSTGRVFAGDDAKRNQGGSA